MFPKLKGWYTSANIYMNVMLCFRGKATGVSLSFLSVDEDLFMKTLKLKYFSSVYVSVLKHSDKKIQLRESLVCLQFQVPDIHKGCRVMSSSIY